MGLFNSDKPEYEEFTKRLLPVVGGWMIQYYIYDSIIGDYIWRTYSETVFPEIEDAKKAIVHISQKPIIID